MPAVYIGEKHLKKSTARKTYSDKAVTGFALRTTPNGVFTFYYQHLNKKTGKRDWHKIGDHTELSIEAARNEARRLAGLAVKGANIKQLRSQQVEQNRAADITFAQLHKEYIDDCKKLVKRRWGMVPRKESWQDTQSALKRPLQWWGAMALGEITDSHIMDLYQSFVDDGHVPQGNRVRGMLHTMFKWGIQPPRKYLKANPCATLPPKEQEVRFDGKKARVLTRDELQKFWWGLDDPKCPGDRLSKLAYKLELVTMLRSGEIVAIERSGVEDDTVRVALAIQKGRRSEMADDIDQPLNSLAREILAKIFEGDEGRRYAFPGTGKRSGKWMDQKTLGHLLTRKSSDEAGKAGILEYLGIAHFTTHALRRTSSTILKQRGYSEGDIGKVLTHKSPDKDASPVTRKHYLIDTPIIEQPVDPRVTLLNDLDVQLRKIIGSPPAKLKLVA